MRWLALFTALLCSPILASEWLRTPLIEAPGVWAVNSLDMHELQINVDPDAEVFLVGNVDNLELSKEHVLYWHPMKEGRYSFYIIARSGRAESRIYITAIAEGVHVAGH